MKFISKFFVTFVLLLSSSVFASGLTAPKANGIIGERFDGYVGIVAQASPKVKALVKKVNLKRKARYQAIAKKRQQQLRKVELIAGESAIKKTLKGNYILLKGQGWKKK